MRLRRRWRSFVGQLPRVGGARGCGGNEGTRARAWVANRGVANCSCAVCRRRARMLWCHTVHGLGAGRVGARGCVGGACNRPPTAAAQQLATHPARRASATQNRSGSTIGVPAEAGRRQSVGCSCGRLRWCDSRRARGGMVVSQHPGIEDKTGRTHAAAGGGGSRADGGGSAAHARGMWPKAATGRQRGIGASGHRGFGAGPIAGTHSYRRKHSQTDVPIFVRFGAHHMNST